MRPTCTWSPLASSCSLICLPLTNVPFELPRSRMTNAVAAAAELGMLARDFGVVQLHGVRRAAAERHVRAVQPEASALIAALDHEQRWHDRDPRETIRRLSSCDRRSDSGRAMTLARLPSRGGQQAVYFTD